MSVAGTWNVTIRTPMGPQVGVLELKDDGGSLVGTMTARGETVALANLTVDGSDLRWEVRRTRPLPMTARFTARITGDHLEGRAKLGPMGESALVGTRAEAGEADGGTR
jgi:hypothetical protein